jgi:L-ascorbate metabolism protein UlaG (beta-lactamase superfamily)
LVNHRPPIDHRAARTRHSDTVAVEAAVQVAAALVILKEGVQCGEPRRAAARYSASHAARWIACHAMRFHAVPVEHRSTTR